jgi:hypothetical protein
MSGERAPATHWMGGWVHPRAGLDDVEKRKFLSLLKLELNPSVIQPVASRCTDYAIPASEQPCVSFIFNYATTLHFILETKEFYEFLWSSQVDKWVNTKCHGMRLLLVFRMVMLFIYGLFL